MGCVYGYQNNINQKWYVGYTQRDIYERRKEHESGVGGAQTLKDAFTKYGQENFSFHVLEDGILPIFLPEREVYWIAKLNSFENGYNLTKGGNGIYKHTPEDVEKISIAQTGRSRSLETRQKMSESKKGEKNPQFGKPPWNKGKTTSKQTRRKQSEAKKGKKRKSPSQETIEKIRTSNLGQKRSTETRKKLSVVHKGKKRGAYSNTHCENISLAKRHPDFFEAQNIYTTLPPEMKLSEKRSFLYAKFPDFHKCTIRRWVRKWQSKLQK